MSENSKDAAVTRLKSLCAAWAQAQDYGRFLEIVNTCVESDVFTQADIRDSLALPPGTTRLWAAGVKPHRLMQEKFVEFVARRVGP